MTNFYTATTTIAVVVTLTAIGIVLTCLRFWVRLSYNKTALGLDDWLIVLGCVVVTVCTGLVIYDAVDGTAGNATADATEQARREHQFDYVLVTVEKMAFGAIKLSLLFFYRRIFGIWSSFRLINNVLIALVAVWAAGFLVTAIFMCGKHPDLYWSDDQLMTRAKCGNLEAELTSFAATDVVTDLIIIAVPLYYVTRLQMSTQNKWGVAFVFLMGFISTACGILRLIFISVASSMGRLTFGYKPPPEDATPLILQVINPSFWTNVEMELGLFAANLPPLSPLIRNVRPDLFIGNLYRKISRSALRTKSNTNNQIETSERKTINTSSNSDKAPLVDVTIPHTALSRDSYFPGVGYAV